MDDCNFRSCRISMKNKRSNRPMILNPKLVSTVQYVLKEQANNLLFQKKMIQFPVGPQKSPEKIIQATIFFVRTYYRRPIIIWQQ